MKRYSMHATTVVMLLLCCTNSTKGFATTYEKLSPRPTAKEAERLIQNQLPQLDFLLTPRSITRVSRLIIREVIRGKKGMEATLGRAELYFPIIEHHLEKYQLPDDLKYIPFVESRLKIRARSAMQAAGLWQFTNYTAKQYHLRMTEHVDERYDPIKSTDAAARLLRDLHLEFGDWFVALAAYNCGAGRVKRAIRKAKSKDYWKIARYLPKQTQHYIPAYIANVYIGHFAEQHELKPKPHTYDFQSVKIVKIHDAVRLSELAKVTETSLQQIRLLNPSYINGIVPASQRGNYLVLPASKLDIVKNYIEKVGKKDAHEIFMSRDIHIAQLDLTPSKFARQSVWRSSFLTQQWLAFITWA